MNLKHQLANNKVVKKGKGLKDKNRKGDRNVVSLCLLSLNKRILA